MRMKTYIYFRTVLYILLLNFTSLFTLCSCAEDEVKVEHKGATLPIMQNIADNVPHIQSVEKEEAYQLFDGINIMDVTFTYCSKPTRMIMAEIDLTKDLTISVSTPDNLNSVGSKLQTVTEQAMCANNAGKTVYMATNGDYFSESNGNPRWVPGGLVYKDGKALWTTLKDGSDHAFYIMKDGTAHISTAEEFDKVKDNVMSALSGWQRLIIDGKPVKDFEVNDNSMEFHPRTFVGVSQDNLKVQLFVLDGRQPEYSNGMRIEDLILLCEGAGCYQALNLDGGGSSTMVKRVEENGNISFELMNKPSDNPIREVLNGLIVIKK